MERLQPLNGSIEWSVSESAESSTCKDEPSKIPRGFDEIKDVDP